MASFFPFGAPTGLNGHSFIEQELKRVRIGCRKNDNAFLAVDDVPALQTAADRLSPQIIRKRLDHWTFILGPKFSKRERSHMNLSRCYSMAQIEYCRNFIFQSHFPIHKIFERSCEIGLWRLTANRISETFGVRRTKKLRGKIATVIEQIKHGHHVLRYVLEKRLTPTIPEVFLLFAQRAVREPSARLRSTQRPGSPRRRAETVASHHRPLRRLSGILATFQLSTDTYGLNQLRYDLRKLKGHGLLERDGSRYTYRLTAKGVQVALLFLFFHKQLCGLPTAGFITSRTPATGQIANSKLRTTKPTRSFSKSFDLLAAA